MDALIVTWQGGGATQPAFGLGRSLAERGHRVVTHAGIGTLMASFAAGVPALCLPLGRDQAGNAERLSKLGAGATLDADSTVEEIRAAILDALASRSLRRGRREWPQRSAAAMVEPSPRSWSRPASPLLHPACC